MIEYTKPLNTNGKLRIGKNLPEDSIEVCKFNNNVNKVKSSNKITASSEKNLSQSKLGKAYRVLKDKPRIDDSLFAKEVEYKDTANFAGVIGRKTTEWIKRVTYEKKKFKIEETKTYSSFNDIPSFTTREIDNHIGVMYATKVELLQENKKITTSKIGKDSKLISKTVISKDGSFPETMLYNEHGYKGTLHKEEECKILNQRPSSFTTNEIISDKVNGSFPSQLERNGGLYYPTGEYDSKTVEHWVKHYGICRYWGGGTSHRCNNYYGDMDYRYTVDGCAKGFFTDGHPDQLLHRWDHWIGRACKHHPEKYPVDIGGYWDTRYGEYSGIKWTYDVEAAKKYGGLDRNDWGGIVWASEYWKHSGGVFPPPGYENDYLGTSHVWKIHQGSSGNISHKNIHLCVKPGAQRTSDFGFNNGYCKWFRDVIAFYKGKTTKKISQAKYKGIILTPNGCDKSNKCVYTGIAYKDITQKEEVTTSLVIKVTYEGILTKTIVKYDGLAYYEGIVYKKVFVDPNIAPANNKVVLIVDSEGYLSYGDTNIIKSHFINITNVSKDGIPLMYKCKVKGKLYLPNGPKEETILDNNYISLKYDTNIIDNITYLTKLTPFEKNYYTVEILVDKLIGCTENVHAHFASYNDKIVEELLCAEYMYKQGIDFKNSETNPTDLSSDTAIKGTSKFKFGDSTTKKDTRRKIHFNYKVKTIDGKYVSNEYKGVILNKRYALESEKINFLGDKMCVSPIQLDEYMTAKEIISRDCTVDITKLKDCRFTIELTSTYEYNVDPYTDIYGNGFIYASTHEDTGYPVTLNSKIEYTGRDKDFYLTSSINGVIYNSFYVELTNQNGLSTLEPYNNNDLKNWYSRISYFPFSLACDRNDTNVIAYYSMSDYRKQKFYEPLQNCYKRITEEPIILNEHSVRLSRDNVLFNFTDDKIVNGEYVTLKSEDKTYTIIGFDIKTSTLITKEVIPSNKKITCTYCYAELTFEYKGFNTKDKFYHLDVNPNKYHSYIRLDNSEEEESYNLFNNTIYIFLKPSKVENLTTKEVIENNINDDNQCYHKINDPEPVGVFDLLIGIVSPMPMSSMHNTKIKPNDTIGGGIKEKYIEINKDNLEGFFDIDLYGEKAIQRNGTMIIKIGNELKNKMNEDEIINTIDKHKAIGVLPIITQ